jgi:hypothetical protein
VEYCKVYQLLYDLLYNTYENKIRNISSRILALGINLWAVSHSALLMHDRPSIPALKPKGFGNKNMNTLHKYAGLR